MAFLYILLILTENSLNNNTKFHRKRGGHGPLGQPQKPPISTDVIYISLSQVSVLGCKMKIDRSIYIPSVVDTKL